MRAFKTIRLAGLVLLLLSLVTCSGDFSDGGSPGLRIQALVLSSDIQLTTDSADQSNPAIAYDPVNNKYLIVWEDDRNSNSNATDIYGRLCDTTNLNSGNCSGTEFAISSTNAMEKEPAVAFDRVNQKYLVVWTDGTNKKIRGRYINPDGTFDGNGNAFDLITTGTPSQPSLVFNEVTQKFNLAWREENNIFDTNNVINNPPLKGSKCSNTYQLKYIPQPYADNYAVVSGEIASGSTPITGNTFSDFVWISGPSDNGNDAITASWLVHRQETSPAVFYDPVSGDTYVAWAGKKATISVNVKYSCPSGQNPPCTCNYQETWSESNVDSYQKVYVRKRTTSIVYDLTFSASDSFSPSVAIDPNTRRALLVWEEQTQNNGKDIKGEIIELSNWQAYQAVTVSSAPSDQTRPRVSFDNVNQRYMVVWEDARNGSSDIPNIGIYGQFIDPQGQLSGSNFPVTTYEKNQLLPAIAFGDTDFRYFFIIWKDGRIPGNADIYGNLWQYSVAPQLEITDENNNPLPADTIDFGSVMTGQSVSRVFRIWNKGNGRLTITGHQDPASPFNISTTWPTTINPGTYYDMTVTFSPTQKGSFNSTIIINSDGGNKTIYLSGNSVEPDIDVSPASLDFGVVDVGLSKTLSLTISNTGNADLTVSSLTTETPFTISESPFTLQPGSSKTITVTFTPQSGDFFTKQLVIISNDPDEGSLTVNLTGTGNAVVTITTTSLRAGTVDGSYSETLRAEGGRKPYTWSIAEGSLPRGLDLAPQTGVISGKPTAIGEYNFTVKVTDADGRVAMKELSIMVYNPITITTTGLKPWTKDVGGYSETLQASGGDGSYTWSIVSGNLPNGLSLSGNQITGTPTLAGDYTFTLRVTDGTGAYKEKEYTIRINAPLQITTDSLPNGTQGVAYSLGISYTGGTAPYTWSATGLPNGLNIDGVTGVISGVPTQAGQSTVTITLQDATGAQVQKSYTLNIYEPVTIMTTSLRAGIVDSSYSETLRAEGGRKPYTWSIAEGSLPRGLDLAPQTGVISGKPTAIGEYNFTVKVTDANGSVATKGLSIMVYNPITITTTGLKPWTKDVGGYSETLQASGGDGNYTWSIVSGNLPNGLSLSGNQITGKITGTPTLAGDYTFTLRVTDGTGAYQEKEYTIRINAPLQIMTDSLPNGTQGVAYSLGISYTGGTAPYTWSATGLPNGLNIDGVTGVISGVPTQAGQSTVTITLQDATGAQVQKSYTLNIYEPVTIMTTSLRAGIVDSSYSETLRAEGGRKPYTWSIAEGSLPRGLDLAPQTGVISGKPTAIGEYNFTVKVTDANGSVATKGLSIMVYNPITITTTGLKPWTKDVGGYSETLQASGGDGNYTWSIVSGNLPNGLSLSGNQITGKITGTPTLAGDYTFTLRVTDGTGAYQEKEYTIRINAPLQIMTDSLPNGTQGVAYSLGISYTGGTAPYTWSATGLPNGLNIDGVTGVISGVPTQAGQSTVTITLQDATGAQVQKSYTLNIYEPVTIMTTSLRAGIVDSSYSETLRAEGGRKPYTWSIAEGSLPRGLDLAPQTGVISGKPTAIGEYNFTVKVTDANGSVATKGLSIMVYNPITITTTGLKPWTKDVGGYSETLQASGGDGNYTWSIVSGNLPNGLSLSGNQITGKITGTPTLAGDYTFTLRVTDGTGAYKEKEYTIRINAPLQITTDSLPNGTQGVAYSLGISYTGGTAPYTWSATGLPNGLNIDGVTGVISGVPTQAGQSTVTITLQDATGAQVQKSYTLNIYEPVTIMTTSLRAGIVDSSYSETLRAEGGRKPYTWSIAEGSLPRGLDLAPQTGVISGKPTAIGEYNFTVKVTDANGSVATKGLSIMVYNPITITTTGLKPWTKDVGGYSETLQASGGDGNYTWSIVSGNLPNGLSLSGNQITGKITGTPTLAGDYTFTLRVTDGTGAYQEKEYTIRINAPLQIMTDSLPNGTQGVAYSLGISYTGGTAPYTWNATGLPDGLVIDGVTGVISGEPTQAGQSTVTITLQDATGAQVQKSYTLKIYNPPDIDISPNTFSFGDVGIGLSKDIVVTMKNTGEAPLTVNTLQLNGSGFVLLNAPQTPFTLNQNASQIFTIRFQPSANVNYSGILTITSNDPDEGNLTYTLTGRGVNPPDIDVTPSLVDFGTVVAGQSKDITVTIKNNITNGADLVISNITVSGNGYTLPTPPSYPITLSAGNTYPITIKFTPPTSGQFSGSLTISSNDPDEGSFKVDLKGNGSEPPDISVSPGKP
jgi:hypothetical protein